MRKILFILLVSITLLACEDFLDKKSDMALTIPESVKDIRAMLDNQEGINDRMPGLGDIASDDYFVDYQTLRSRPIRDQGLYIWDGDQDTYHAASWTSPYYTIMIANIALEGIERISNNNTGELLELEQLRGKALFIRAVNYFALTQIFCAPYDLHGTNEEKGIVLRTSSDLNIESVRSTINESYANIITDLNEAALLLPERAAAITRPDQCAVNALLSRVYLSMQDYEKSLHHAEATLRIKDDLLDYNKVDHTHTAPFSTVMENPEIIYFARSTSAGTFLTPARANVDTVLLTAYENHDVRQKVFFDDKNNGYKAFKGSYAPFTTNLFHGLATDEVYLTAAECHARLNNPVESLYMLNTLLEHRYAKGAFQPYANLEGSELLDLVLLERRKQLLFRGVRWMDLRRLNFDPRYQKTLYRVIDNGNGMERYELPPNDLRYTHLIPMNVIERTSIAQNPR